MFKKLVYEYIDLTAAMLSALKSRRFDIFENLISSRKDILNKIEKIDDKYIIENEKEIIKDKILKLESSIKVEMDEMKRELEGEQNKNKLKLKEIETKRKVHSSYRNINENSGLIFDRKK
ncbi:hypothetical protein [Helicovermis profundi]|uniref:Flagellar protein FliT n=1 Tax=Helicovermis profundi TaxID=3065157 RepID=A0AAU9E7T5_9FIRM|nr:hypothetical protein HLPR_25260 [Clostridia bacterium S502]